MLGIPPCNWLNVVWVECLALDTVRQPFIIFYKLSLHHLVEFRILNGLTS
jgi:hypothetical protein